jgi:uncharacterized protein
MFRKFNCIEGCSDCCVKREYFPSRKFGKIGVLLLPEEKGMIEQAAKKMKVNVTILPRIGVGTNDDNSGPKSVLVYQLMGMDKEGNVCPFLDREGIERSPHGGARCKIYDKRPLACKAYPVVDFDHASSMLDSRCTYCVSNNAMSAGNSGLTGEIEALKKIMADTYVSAGTEIWRYATNVGDPYSGEMLPEGWIKAEVT